jgi:hypothetical protein
MYDKISQKPQFVPICHHILANRQAYSAIFHLINLKVWSYSAG